MKGCGVPGVDAQIISNGQQAQAAVVFENALAPGLAYERTRRNGRKSETTAITYHSW